MIDRKIPPVAQEIKSIEFTRATTVRLNGRNNLHYVNQDELNVLKFEIEFHAGTKYQQKPLIANIVNSLILEGSEKYSAFEIAEYFDSRGAFLETACNADTSSIVLHCMERNIEELLPFLFELLQTVKFSQKEIDNYLEVHSQKFKVNQEKGSWVARNEFLEMLLGKDNSYSNKIVEEDFGQIQRNDLVTFYNINYLSNVFDIYLAGKVSQKVIECVERTFSTLKPTLSSSKFNAEIKESSQQQKIILKEKSIQTAVRLGKVSIGRNHKDFPVLFVANTILGGYFGSRLMTNIREDKGYTYGVGSGIINLQNLSYFVISTEVGSEFTKDTLRQIEIEMNKLGNELVNSGELQLVKNYILGNILKGFDGAFNSMERFQMLNQQNLTYEYYTNLIGAIRSIEPEDIQRVSQEYLEYAKLKKMIVGKN